MNRISALQLFALLLLQSIWEVICLPSLPGSGALLGAWGAYALQLLLLLPLLSRDTGLLRRKWAGLLFAGFFLLAGARNLTQLSGASPGALLSVPGRTGASVLLLLTCLYTASVGIKAAARCAPLTMGLLLLSAVILAAGAWGHTDPERFYWERDGLQEGGRLFFTSAELPALWVLRRRLEGSSRKVLFGYTIAKMLLTGFVLYLCIAAGGRLAQTAEYPFFTLTALSQPLQGQRADALYILVFVMLSVMQITVQAGLAAHLTEEMFPKLHHTAPFILLAMTALSGILSGEVLEGLTGMLLPVLAFGIPCTFLLSGQLQRRTAI